MTFGSHMNAARRYLKRLHHRAGWLTIGFLMLPILIWVWPAAREPVISVFNGAVPRSVLSGQIFSAPFDRAHAGFSMDQPTIGKWLFWFTFMTASSLPYAAVVRWLSNRTERSGALAYAACVGILGVFLLCILSWPMCWLIQYVCSMGFTPRRTYGLLYAVAGGVLVIGFMWSAFRRLREKDFSPGCCRRCGYDLRGSVGRPECPECGEPIRGADCGQSLNSTTALGTV